MWLGPNRVGIERIAISVARVKQHGRPSAFEPATGHSRFCRVELRHCESARLQRSCPRLSAPAASRISMGAVNRFRLSTSCVLHICERKVLPAPNAGAELRTARFHAGRLENIDSARRRRRRIEWCQVETGVPCDPTATPNGNAACICPVGITASHVVLRKREAEAGDRRTLRVRRIRGTDRCGGDVHGSDRA